MAPSTSGHNPDKKRPPRRSSSQISVSGRHSSRSHSSSRTHSTAQLDYSSRESYRTYSTKGARSHSRSRSRSRDIAATGRQSRRASSRSRSHSRTRSTTTSRDRSRSREPHKIRTPRSSSKNSIRSPSAGSSHLREPHRGGHPRPTNKKSSSRSATESIRKSHGSVKLHQPGKSSVSPEKRSRHRSKSPSARSSTSLVRPPPIPTVINTNDRCSKTRKDIESAPPVKDITIIKHNIKPSKRNRNDKKYTKKWSLNMLKIREMKDKWIKQGEVRTDHSQDTGRTEESGFSVESVEELIAAVKNKKRNKNKENTDVENDANRDTALSRRIKDFEQARQLRRDRGDSSSYFGIFGLFMHLSDVRLDLQWAEDAAWRRDHGKPYVSWNDYEYLNRKAYNIPLLSYSVLLLSSLMMLYEFNLNQWRVEKLSINPMIGPSPEVLYQVGGLKTSAIVNDNEWYRLFSPLIIHAGVIHYVINMLAIWLIGSAVEKAHGMITTSVIFIVSAVGGNILSAVFHPFAISVGSSGGIFGLVGVCVADIVMNWDLIFINSAENEKRTTSAHLLAIFSLVLEIVLNLLIGLTPFVDNFAHLGGFMYGICCALPVINRIDCDFYSLQGVCTNLRTGSIRMIGLVLSCVLMISSLILLLNSDGETIPCKACSYISCAPFPFWTEKKWWECKI